MSVGGRGNVVFGDGLSVVGGSTLSASAVDGVSLAGQSVDVIGTEGVDVVSDGSSVELGSSAARASASRVMDIVSGETLAASSDSVSVSAGVALGVSAVDLARVSGETMSVVGGSAVEVSSASASVVGHESVEVFSGGAVSVGFNAPGRPPSPPTLTIKNCDFLDNVGKNGGGHAVHFGKGSARQGQQYDNQLQLSSAG